MKIGAIRPTTVLAKTLVSSSSDQLNSNWHAPQALVKRLLFRNQGLINTNAIYGDIDFHTRPDGYITFNNNDNLFYYSIDDADIENKYYFVTTALREIAKILGFKSDAVLDDVAQVQPNYGIQFYRSTYDDFMYKNINDIFKAFSFATSNNVVKEINQDNYKFYAPSDFLESVSLSYFDIDSNNHNTKLMQPFQNKGEIIQNISTSVMDVLMSGIFWEGVWAVGSGGGVPAGIGNSDVVPYNSSLTFSTSSFHSPQEIKGISVVPIEENRQKATREYNYYPEVEQYLSQFDEYNTNKYGWTVSIMKTDGSWDVVIDKTVDNDYPNMYGSVTISNDMIDPAKVDEYTRTSDGFLRLKIALYDGVWSEYDYRKRMTACHYRTYDYKPAVPKFSLSRFNNTNVNGGEWTEDIQIGLGNLEGVDKILVEQWDEFTIPFKYFVNNPKKGEFLATVDIEYPTNFILTYINKNGSTLSKRPYTHTPPNPVSQASYVLNTAVYEDGHFLDMKLVPMGIAPILRRSRVIKVVDIVDYEIIGVSRAQSIKRGRGSEMISISDLPKGVYGVRVKDNNGYTYYAKFLK